MNFMPLEMENLKREQRKEKIDLIHKYQDKLKLSIISFLFFLMCTIFLMHFSIMGIAAPIVSGIVALVFIQQIIRSYNYREFHKNNYKFMEGMYEAVNENLKLED